MTDSPTAISPAVIRVTGARENNLRDVTVEVPKRAITAFVGVSGSGKSSLVFDTIAAEAQRQLNETFSAFVRGFLPKLGQPDADLIENLSTAIVVDQKRLGGGSRSTLGTVTDINPLLRLLWSRRSEPHVGPGYEFSFNEPQGMCPELQRDRPQGRAGPREVLRPAEVAQRGRDPAPRLRRRHLVLAHLRQVLALRQRQAARATTPRPSGSCCCSARTRRSRSAIPGSKDVNFEFEGVETKFNRLFIAADEKGASASEEGDHRPVTPPSVICPECDGTRLNRGRPHGHRRRPHPARGVRDGPGHAARAAARRCATPPVAPLVAEATARVGALIDMGLGYLTLDRETSTLSGGE